MAQAGPGTRIGLVVVDADGREIVAVRPDEAVTSAAMDERLLRKRLAGVGGEVQRWHLVDSPCGAEFDVKITHPAPGTCPERGRGQQGRRSARRCAVLIDEQESG